MDKRASVRGKAAGAALLLTVAAFIFGTPASAYPEAQVTNTTKFLAHVRITYVSSLCRDDAFSVNPGLTAHAGKRGGCLIKRVAATLAGGPAVRSFESSGTSYSTFSLVSAGGEVVVQRI